MRKSFYTIVFCFYTFFIVNAQDIHFSHIHASPILLNPAMTGLFDGGNIRFIANSRVQWETFTNGYKTFAGSIDAKAIELNSNTIVGTGLMLFSDKAGDLGFQTSSAGLSLSVLRSLDNKGRNFVSLGFQSNYYQNRVDFSKMVGHELDHLVVNGASDNIQYWDVSAGLGWYYAFDRHNYYYLGAALYHINEPDVSFSKELIAENNPMLDNPGNTLFRKLVLHGGAQFRLAKYMTALPSFIFLDQGPHREIKMGTFIKFKQKSRKKSDHAFYIGSWLRWYAEKDMAGIDALDVSARLDFNKTSITFSFDFNLSTLSRASMGLGGPELSFIKIIDADFPRNKNRRVKCPIL